MQEEGYNWKKSKERREQERREEMERQERLNIAAEKKEKTLQKIEKTKLQKKITDSLNQIPRNRRILLEQRLEKERRMTLKEAKEEIWKKWRHSKGKRKNNPNKLRPSQNHDLEEKLEKIEKEVENYREELEKIKQRKEEKEKRKEKQAGAELGQAQAKLELG